LLGISAVGAAVAQKTTTSNERLHFDNWSWLVAKGVIPINKPATPRWSDLVMTNREFDVYKLQTLIFTGVVAVALLVTGEDRLDSFSVPETLLGILGLSQIVYVAGALVRPPSVSELDKALTELRELDTKVGIAVTYNIDTDDAGNLPSPLPKERPKDPPSLDARVKAGLNVMRQYNKKADQVEIMLESTLETQVKREDLDFGSVGSKRPSKTTDPETPKPATDTTAPDAMPNNPPRSPTATDPGAEPKPT
jgi:hypothetical protein